MGEKSHRGIWKSGHGYRRGEGTEGGKREKIEFRGEMEKDRDWG